MRRRLVAFAVVLAVIPSSAAAQGITEYPLPAGSQPVYIITGHDGRLWFPMFGTAQIGRIGTNGALQQSVPSAAEPLDIVAGPEGGMYWTGPRR